MRLEIDLAGRRFVLEGRGTAWFTAVPDRASFAVEVDADLSSLAALAGPHAAAHLVVERSVVVSLAPAEVVLEQHPPTVTIRGRM